MRGLCKGVFPKICARAADARKYEGISPTAEFAFGVRAVRSVVFLRL